MEKFNKTIQEMINFIIIKLFEYNNIINKEIENIFTDEYNEKIKKLSNLLNEFNFNNDENKFNEMFRILNKSIFKQNEKLEYKIDLNKNILYEGNVIKGTNIKNGKGIEYKINKDNIIFEGEYLNGERWNGKGKEYYLHKWILYGGKVIKGTNIKNRKGIEY